MYPQAPEARAARELLGAINTGLFFSRDDLFGKTEYVVERGDSLARIARRLKSSPEMIMRANDLDSTVIRVGERLLVPDGDFTSPSTCRRSASSFITATAFSNNTRSNPSSCRPRASRGSRRK